MNVSLQAQMLLPVLIVTSDVANKEEGWKFWSIQEQIQWRLLNKGKEILNIIPLKLAVVWRKTVGHSVYTIHSAWKIPLHSECFNGKGICFFRTHSFFRQSYLTLQRLLSPCLCVHLYSYCLNLGNLELQIWIQFAVFFVGNTSLWL